VNKLLNLRVALGNNIAMSWKYFH